jgi:hypothetical protein
MKKEKKPMVTVIDRTTFEQTMITLEEAVIYLSGCWKEETIVPMLLGGQTLWTPYYEYCISIDK